MFQTLGRSQREVRNHLAGCALGAFIGGDEQDSTSWACCGISWMLGRLEETQALVCVSCLFKHQNYTTHASRAQGMASENGAGEF